VQLSVLRGIEQGGVGGQDDLRRGEHGEEGEEEEGGKNQMQTWHVIIDNLINFKLIYHIPVLCRHLK
jgi:hypothetical protein